MKILKLISINIIVLTVFLLIVDFSNAYIRRRGGLERVSARHIHAFFHHGLIPNATFKHNWIPEDILIEKVNKFGFRSNLSDKYINDLEDYNTVLIGDSFAEGVGVENDKIIPSLLPKNLWPIANLGIISHTPYLSRYRLQFYKDKGLQAKRIIHLIDPSDFQDEIHYKKVEGFKPPKNKILKQFAILISDSFLSSSFTWETFLTLSWLFNAESWTRSIDLYKYWNGSNNYYKERNPFKGKEEPFYYQEAKSMLLKEIKLSIANNINSKYIIVIYEWPQMINSETLSANKARINEYKNNVKEIINEFKNASFCDASKASLISSDYIKGDVHWNESGHKKIAKYISKKCL